MKNAENINPLVNPVLPEDRIQCGEKVYQVDVDMRGLWKVYHEGRVVAQGIQSQGELCAWLYRASQQS